MYSMIRQREEYFKEKEIWFKKGLATPFRKNFFKPAKKTYFATYYYFAGDQCGSLKALWQKQYCDCSRYTSN